MSRTCLLIVCLMVAHSFAFVGNQTPPSLLNPAPSSVQLIKPVGPVPAARTGAALASSPLGFILLGGSVAYGDNLAWSYNASGENWTELKTKFAVFGACSVQHGDFLYIYGGSSPAPSNKLFRYQVSKDEVVDMNVTGTHPTQGVSCGWRNGTIYLVGGNNKDNALVISKLDTTAKELKWESVTPTDPHPANPVGASGLVFNDEFVLFGGSADSNVWRYNFLTNVWSVDKSNSPRKPDTRSYHSAAVDSVAVSPSFVIFGGSDFGSKFALHNDSWVYNLPNMTWVQLEPRALTGTPSPREMANSIYIEGRFFIFSGSTSQNDTADDLWELVITEDCYARSDCDECVNVVGCGWCALNTPGYQCLPGAANTAYIKTDCTADFSRDLTICPPDGFPGWIIAIIIVATILVIGVAWYMVLRCQKKSGGYEQIN